MIEPAVPPIRASNEQPVTGHSPCASVEATSRESAWGVTSRSQRMRRSAMFTATSVSACERLVTPTATASRRADTRAWTREVEQPPGGLPKNGSLDRRRGLSSAPRGWRAGGGVLLARHASAAVHTRRRPLGLNSAASIQRRGQTTGRANGGSSRSHTTGTARAAGAKPRGSVRIRAATTGALRA